MIAEEAAASYIEQAYELGAADFIPLPFHPAVVRQRAANAVALYESQGLLAGMSQERARQNAMMADILGHIVEFRNQESRHHILNVHMLTELLLRRLAGSTDRYRLSEDDISLISTVSAFHDIGKIAIPTEILNKPGRLTREEFEVMKTHSRIGGRILRQLPAYQEEPFVKLAYQICRWHHERYDGGGYPDGLKGEEIPIAAQVVAAADVYDALTSERVYKKAVPQEEAVWMIENGMCGAFQPLLLKCLGGAVRELPAAFKGLAAKMPGHGCAGAGRERALTV